MRKLNIIRFFNTFYLTKLASRKNTHTLEILRKFKYFEILNFPQNYKATNE